MTQSISQLHSDFKNKHQTVLGNLNSHLELIEKYDSGIKSFLTLTLDQARSRAADLDKQLTEDQTVVDKNPLFGVPVGLKDLFLTAGIRTTAASKVLENYIPQYSATSWKKMENAGSILVGKLNCDAWAHGSSGENSDFQITRNPWNLDYVPGGSSSGSAAAVAANFVSIAMGTDTGGSIRLPASFCNVVGLKPTYGRVSRYGVVSMASSLDSIGHFGHSVEDVARVLAVTAGQDKYDASSNPAVVPQYHQNLELPKKVITIGIPEEYFSAGLNKEVGEAMEEVKKVYEKEFKIKFLPLSMPNTKYGIAVYYIVQTSEVSSNLGRYDGIRYGNNRDSFGSEAKRRIMLGTYVLSAGHQDAYYKRAQQVRTLIKKDFDQAFTKVDALLAPVSPTPPFKIGSKSDNPLEMYLSDVLTVNMNLSGVPGIAIPGGFTSNGLPVGFQLIGPHFSEQLLFQLGHAYQTVTDWNTKNPKL